eukprot:1824793-Rhodomonas_salina.2
MVCEKHGRQCSLSFALSRRARPPTHGISEEDDVMEFPSNSARVIAHLNKICGHEGVRSEDFLEVGSSILQNDVEVLHDPWLRRRREHAQQRHHMPMLYARENRDFAQDAEQIGCV